MWLEVVRLLVDTGQVLAIVMVARAIRGYWEPDASGYDGQQPASIDDIME